MSKVIFQIEGGTPVSITCNTGDNLLEAARRANVAIDAPCSGNGSCGKCRIKLIEGSLDSIQSRHISEEEWAEGWRLSCCSKVSGDCTVLVPDIASAYQSRMKTAITVQSGDSNSGGIVAGEGAKDISCLITHCETPLAVSKLDAIKQFGPQENQLFDGTAIQARYLYDLFVPSKRLASIGAVVAP